MLSYAVFCVDATRTHPTTHVSCHDTASIEAAKLAEEINALSELLYDLISPARALLRGIDCGDIPLNRGRYKLPLSGPRRALLEVEASAPPWTLRWG